MNSLFVEITQKNPEVDFNYKKGKLIIRGKSIGHNAAIFYKPVMNWVKEYARKPRPATTVEVSLEYYNTTSFKALLDILKELAKLHPGQTSMTVNWYYEEDDEDLHDTGIIIKELVKTPFKLISVKQFDFS